MLLNGQNIEETSNEKIHKKDSEIIPIPEGKN